jgi:tRNA pseudouridine55 synthase
MSQILRSGLLIIDKPAGVSSRDCLNQLQRIIGDRKFKLGHAGTLDPLATGVLIVAVGEATRLVEQLHELDKQYSAEFEFGKSSDTLDREGEIVVHHDDPLPTREQLVEAGQRWTGLVMQQPPRYSAIKVQGRRAYELARRGNEFDLPERPVRIDRITVTRWDYPFWNIDIVCGSGTYVRSLGCDLAHTLGSHAIMTALVRTAVGPFSLADAVALDDLTSLDDIAARLLSPLAGLPTWLVMELDARQVQAIRHGRSILWHTDQVSRLGAGSQPCMAVDDQGQWVALLELLGNNHARPVRVFQTMMAISQPSTTKARHNPES